MTGRRFFFFGTLLLIVSLLLWRAVPAPTVKVGVFFDSADTSEAVISRQALQSVMLAIEYFNSRSPSFKIRPVPIFAPAPPSDLQHPGRNIAAIVTGPRITSSPLLSQPSRRGGVPVISLAAGSLLPGKESLVFRPRPRTGGFALGCEAARRGVKNYSVIVSGFDIGYVQEFIRDFEAGLGAPPRRTMVFGGDLEKQIAHFDRIVSGMDAMLLALPDWPATIAFREIRLRAPGIPVFASNRVISHRSPLLASGETGNFYTSAVVPEESFMGREGFYRFVADTYGDHIPPCILAIGFDGVAMLSAALSRTKTPDRHLIAEALVKLDSVDSSTGPVRMDQRGDLAVKNRVMALAPGGWAPLEETRPEGEP